MGVRSAGAMDLTDAPCWEDPDFFHFSLADGDLKALDDLIRFLEETGAPLI